MPIGLQSISVNRREFISSALSAAAMVSPFATIARAIAASPSSVETRARLTHGWQFLRESLAGPWEAYLKEQTNPWADVTLPHCFNAYDGCDPDIPYYQGPGWYRITLRAANPFKDGRMLLHFEGAGQETSIYAGDTLLQHHIGGYDEFIVDITDALAERKNAEDSISIAILCTNAHNLDRIPSQMSDFSLYGGLYRHVNLLYVPALSIESTSVRIEDVSSASAEVTIDISLYAKKKPDQAHISLDILDPSGHTIHHEDMTINDTGENQGASARFRLSHPKLWSPAAPFLYQCRILLRTDAGEHSATERFGVRFFEFEEHGPFKLNGERLLLRGTHRHEDHADYAAALPDEIIREEMQMIKEMGANFIRLGHYQQSRQVLDLCDELGLLVWEEIPWCRGGVGNETMQQMTRDKLHNMIRQHGNHPSIILWGLGNEDDWPGEYPAMDQQAIRGLMQQLHTLAHQLDRTRLTSLRRCDFARDIPDVYSPSIWAGWYSGSYTEYEASLEKERMRVKHMLHIEWGADSHAGRHAEVTPQVKVAEGHGTDERGLAFMMTGGPARFSKDGDWSETYACDLFEWHLKVQETLPWFTGSAQWVFKDFTTPLRAENPVPRINQKGVVTRDLRKKESYYVFQSYWAQKPMAHIYGHTWPVRWGKPGEEKTVKVYSNCSIVELFVNGKSLGTKRRDSQNFPSAGLRWPSVFNEGKNHLRVIAQHGSTTVVDEVEFEYAVTEWQSPALLRLMAVPQTNTDAGGVIEVAASLHDVAGVLCLDARNVVRFSLAGEGRLLDNQGTPWGSRVVQLANGKASIKVAKAVNKQCVVAVTSEGITTAILKLV